MFADSVARVDYKGQYPHIVIPLSNPTYFIDQILAEAKSIDEAGGEVGEGEINDAAYILLWANRLEGDTYEEATTNTKVAEKSFDALQLSFALVG
ncbi:MAG: hypothetical protein MZU79_03045 [Anaerotruncus sp.]|nr:hypothetical protein [Anaerotruncus sp.]